VGIPLIVAPVPYLYDVGTPLDAWVPPFKVYDIVYVASVHAVPSDVFVYPLSQVKVLTGQVPDALHEPP